MQLKFIKSDWGMEVFGDLRARCLKYAAAGYDGVELGFPGVATSELNDILAESGLEYIPMMFARTEDEFAEQLGIIRQTKPLLVNCHPGRDHYSFERGLQFFRTAKAMASDALDCDIVFETHRQTLLYAPWTTRRYLVAIPDLRITADFSHFTTVSETDMSKVGRAFPDPEAGNVLTAEKRVDPELEALLGRAIKATGHIHARVGDAHGPQVADPSRGEGLEWTELFESWWDRIIQENLNAGRAFLTINPEFGPPPYAPADPATGEAFIDVWDTCLWICDRFRQRWPTLTKRQSA